MGYPDAAWERAMTVQKVILMKVQTLAEGWS